MPRSFYSILRCCKTLYCRNFVMKICVRKGYSSFRPAHVLRSIHCPSVSNVHSNNPPRNCIRFQIPKNISNNVSHPLYLQTHKQTHLLILKPINPFQPLLTCRNKTQQPACVSRDDVTMIPPHTRNLKFEIAETKAFSPGVFRFRTAFPSTALQFGHVPSYIELPQG